MFFFLQRGGSEVKKIATDIKAGDRVRLPWIGGMSEIHHTHMTGQNSYVGPCVVLSFGPGRAPVEVPADSHVDVV